MTGSDNESRLATPEWQYVAALEPELAEVIRHTTARMAKVIQDAKISAD